MTVRRQKRWLPRLREILKSADEDLSRTVTEAIKEIAAELERPAPPDE